MIFDAIQMGNWQRAGKKGRRKPKPLAAKLASTKPARFGNTYGRSDEEVKAALARYAGRTQEVDDGD